MGKLGQSPSRSRAAATICSRCCKPRSTHAPAASASASHPSGKEDSQQSGTTIRFPAGSEGGHEAGSHPGIVSASASNAGCHRADHAASNCSASSSRRSRSKSSRVWQGNRAIRRRKHGVRGRDQGLGSVVRDLGIRARGHGSSRERVPRDTRVCRRGWEGCPHEKITARFASPCPCS